MREQSAYRQPGKFSGRPKKKNRKGGFGKNGFGRSGSSANGNTANGNTANGNTADGNTANGNTRNGYGRNGSGNSGDHQWQRMLAAHSTSSVCQKCGQPAPDGKLCTFHRNLLNTIRNDFR
jgi:hypothetical protein